MTRALILAALLSYSAAAGSAPAPAADMLPIQTYDDLIAAETCMHKGYPYMVRIGPHDVLCLMSPVGVAKRAVKVQDVIDAAVRRIRGK